MLLFVKSIIYNYYKKTIDYYNANIYYIIVQKHIYKIKSICLFIVITINVYNYILIKGVNYHRLDLYRTTILHEQY